MPRTGPDEDGLVRAMQYGDEAALCQIIDLYTPYVGTIVWNIVEDRLDMSDAGEIVSDVFYTLWQNAARVMPGRLKGYLASISRTRAINALRKAGRDICLEDDSIFIGFDDPEDETIKKPRGMPCTGPLTAWVRRSAASLIDFP